jgi:hypothetical protein
MPENSMFSFLGKKDSGPKDPEKMPGIDDKLEKTLAELKELPGPEFIQRIRELNADPDFAKSVENYNGNKRLKKDVLHALFFVDREAKDTMGLGPDFSKQTEHFYWPENVAKDRRYMNRVYGGIFGTLTVLGGSIGVMVHQERAQMAEEKEKEQTWIKEKLQTVSTIDEIDQQADTIFNGLKDNTFVYEAYDTVQKTANKLFAEQHAGLEKKSVEQITGYLETLELQKPEVFKELVFGYWKSKNNLPSSYNSHTSYEVEEPIRKLQKDFDTEKETLDKKQESITKRLYASYKNAYGAETTVSYTEAQKISEQAAQEKQKANQTESKNDSINPEYVKFSEHVDSLVNGDFNEYSAVFNSPLAKEVGVLEHRIQDILNTTESKQNEAKSTLDAKRDQEIQEVRNRESGAAGAHIEELSKKFPKEVMGYLEDYYLVNEAFGHYRRIKDSVSENEMAVLSKDPIVIAALKEIVEHNKQSETALADEI